MLPRKYPVRSTPELAVQPFFVFGSGRNGSTMLNRMLNQHSELFLPSEQYFLGNSIIKYKLYNFLIWRDLIKIIAGELLPSTESTTWSIDLDKMMKPLMALENRSLQSVIELIFRSYGAQTKEFSIWGDTTPLNTYYLPEILSVYPKAKYIFLIRDGRDVVASYKTAGEEYLGRLANPDQAAEHWMHSIAKYKWAKKKISPANLYLLRYEQLVASPMEELKKLCDFLGISFEPGMLDFHENKSIAAMYQEPQHANIRRPVSESSVGKWKSVFAGNEPFFERINTSLSNFDYP